MNTGDISLSYGKYKTESVFTKATQFLFLGSELMMVWESSQNFITNHKGFKGYQVIPKCCTLYLSTDHCPCCAFPSRSVAP